MTHSSTLSMHLPRPQPPLHVDSSSPASSPPSSVELTPSSSATTPMSASSSALTTPRSHPSVLLNSDEQFIDDVSLRFLYQPHTILSFFLVLALLVYFAFHPSQSLDSPTASLVTNVKLGVFVCSLFVLLLGLLVFPSGPFVRPHPLLWRLTFGLGVLYQLSLILLLFQTKAHARAALGFLYPELGRPLEERTYAANCELTPANLWGALDLFAFGHLVGWMVKAVIIRDMWVCWFISVQWECIELCFKHWLPNFAECWWDSWLLDVLLCNGLGIYLGHVICQRLEMRAYRWTRIQDIPTLLGKARRAALQFTPGSWMQVRWESTSTISRFLTINVVALLWIPPPNSLNILRLLIWAGLGPSAIRQVYIYTHSPHVRSVGMYTFLSCCILATEVLLILKLSKGEFTAETPRAVRVGVAAGLLLYAVVVAVVCLRIGWRGGSAEPKAVEEDTTGRIQRLKSS